MERNTIKEMKEIIEAIEAGKPIQCKCVSDGDDGVWEDTTNNAYPNFYYCVYRIKSEEPKKKWRPFNNLEEFINAAGGLGAIWLKRKDINRMQLVISIDYDDNDKPIRVCSVWESFNKLLENYTFADGTPCGVEEDA